MHRKQAQIEIATEKRFEAAKMWFLKGMLYWIMSRNRKTRNSNVNDYSLKAILIFWPLSNWPLGYFNRSTKFHRFDQSYLSNLVHK